MPRKKAACFIPRLFYFIASEKKTPQINFRFLQPSHLSSGCRIINFAIIPPFEKGRLGGIYIYKSPSIPLFQRGRQDINLKIQAKRTISYFQTLEFKLRCGSYFGQIPKSLTSGPVPITLPDFRHSKRPTQQIPQFDCE